MKKLLLATAVAALSVTAAQAAPQVYGKVFLTLDAQDGNDNSDFKDARTQLNSNASRIGVRGAEPLTANTNLVYQLEYRVEADHEFGDNAPDRNFEARDTFLGLSNKQYGTVLAGRLTAIDSMVDYANVTTGGVLGGDAVQASVDAPRANNAIAYVSPSYNGVNFLGMYVMDENNPQDTLGRDAFGVGVQYEPANAPFRAGATYIAAGKSKAARISGAYDLNAATTIGALYQNTQDKEGAFGMSGTEKENTFTVSAEHKIVQTPWTAYGQLDLVDNRRGVKDAERLRGVVGGKYAFNQATTGHIYGAYMRDEAGSVKENSYGVGAGIEYKF